MNNALMLLAVFVAQALPAAQMIPAFPGAEGFGADTPGGRGGRVLKVTNLDDYAAGIPPIPGSLRAACDTRGPRIVVFAVSGLISLKRELRITEPYLTVAGQTAPGDGICVRNHTFYVKTHDVIVRFIRSRLGPVTGQAVDAISIGDDSENVILDHCTASWAVDENLSPSAKIRNITVQWCIASEGLINGGHQKGGYHSYGSLTRGIGGITLHHNLWAHNNGRNPMIGDDYHRKPSPTFDIRNNVTYDYGYQNLGTVWGVVSANYVANYIKPGPSSIPTKKPISIDPETADAKFFLADNYVVGHPEYNSDNSKMFNLTERKDSKNHKGRKLVTLVNTPFDAPPVTATSAVEAYEAVLDNVGCTRPVRDSVDARVIADVRNGTGHLLDFKTDWRGWPQYKSAPAPLDSDGDGIPDDWERAHGLDPHDPNDAGAVSADGYTNIEVYLNELANPVRRSSP